MTRKTTGLNNTPPGITAVIAATVPFRRDGDPSRWDRVKVAALVSELRRAAVTARWPGKAGKTDRAVLLHALDMAGQFARLHLKLACRDAGLRAGVVAMTASRSLRRLIAAGWLVRLPVPREDCDAYTYLLSPLKAARAPSLSLPDSCIGSDLHGCPADSRSEDTGQACATGGPEGPAAPGNPGICPAQGVSADQDVTETAAMRAARIAPTELGVHLGSCVTEVGLCLTGKPQRVSELARKAAVSTATVSRALRVLAGMGAAAKAELGWIAGKPLEGYRLDPQRVKARIARVEDDRSAHYARQVWLEAQGRGDPSVITQMLGDPEVSRAVKAYLRKYAPRAAPRKPG